jgi:hypothetical protein
LLQEQDEICPLNKQTVKRLFANSHKWLGGLAREMQLLLQFTDN